VTHRDPGHRCKQRIEQPHVASSGERKGEADSDHGSKALQHELAPVAQHVVPAHGAADSEQQHRSERDDAVEFADPVTPDAAPGFAEVQHPRRSPG